MIASLRMIARPRFGISRHPAPHATQRAAAASAPAAIKEGSCPEVHALMGSGKRYLDVRTVEEFVAGHAPGAINVPVKLAVAGGMAPNPEFPSAVAATFTDMSEAIVVGCKSGARSMVACEIMKASGYNDLTNVTGGWMAWDSAGLPTEKGAGAPAPVIKERTPSEVHAQMGNGKRFLDVRTVEEFVAGHAPGAINVPVKLAAPGGMALNPDFPAGVAAAFADKSETIMVGCGGGIRSMAACEIMKASGYRDLTNLTGGFSAWQSAGLPTEK
ncbi:hypothetical protein FOA52_011134 [Chlamydomonas sp. UWO 241]|nr:hypothetical protein FOA52_011134 [Chlamydomonas sp. UWO 241]